LQDIEAKKTKSKEEAGDFSESWREDDDTAATYDLVIKGGRVIDPSLGINAIGDVAIAAGRIAAVGDNIASVVRPRVDAGSSWNWYPRFVV
jgi:N-acyl-D-aspartate/D-glutamate deacylase